MPDLGGLWTAFVNNPIVQLGVRFAGLYVLGLYLATVFWTVRDAQQRTENRIMPYFAGLLVVLTWILGLFLYLIIRPRETLGEAYERQLAEESLLAEAEQRVVCPTCRERVQDDYILCPTCRTRLKRQCPSCGKLIRPEWNICPFCTKDFDERDWTVHPGGKTAAGAGAIGPRDATEKIST
jgi:RNA polymerase subunit RPABC4/transcription elongation factor Spt4